MMASSLSKWIRFLEVTAGSRWRHCCLYLPWSLACLAMRLGADHAVKSDPLDYETGIVFGQKVGEHVKKGNVLPAFS